MKDEEFGWQNIEIVDLFYSWILLKYFQNRNIFFLYF